MKAAAAAPGGVRGQSRGLGPACCWRPAGARPRARQQHVPVYSGEQEGDPEMRAVGRAEVTDKGDLGLEAREAGAGRGRTQSPSREPWLRSSVAQSHRQFTQDSTVAAKSVKNKAGRAPLEMQLAVQGHVSRTASGQRAEGGLGAGPGGGGQGGVAGGGGGAGRATSGKCCLSGRSRTCVNDMCFPLNTEVRNTQSHCYFLFRVGHVGEEKFPFFLLGPLVGLINKLAENRLTGNKPKFNVIHTRAPKTWDTQPG